MHRRVFNQTVTDYKSFLIANAQRFFAERGRTLDAEAFNDCHAETLDDFARTMVVYGADITVREDVSEFEPAIVAA